MSKTVQPKVLQKMATRFAIGLLVIAGLVLGYQWLLGSGGDFDTGDFKSADYILALKEADTNLEAVLIDPNGAVVDNPGYTSEFNDTLAAWGPNGQRAYVVSDREKGEAHVFRWNPVSKQMQRKSLDSAGKTYMTFQVPGSSTPSETALMISGGRVLEYNPKTGEAVQVLPPRASDVKGAGGDEGASGAFEMMYSALGHSFAKAMWGPNKNGIYAVMKRDEGQVLIWQGFQDAKPSPIAFAQVIEFDVSPVTGDVVFALQGFQKPPKPERMSQDEYDAQKRTWEHMLATFTPGKPMDDPIVGTPLKGKVTFGSPSVSPDGSTVVFTFGSFDDQGNFRPEGVAAAPPLPRSAPKSGTVFTGEVYDVSWHPTKKLLVYTKVENGKNAIYTFDMGSGTEKRMSPEGASFRMPRFSPQQ